MKFIELTRLLKGENPKILISVDNIKSIEKCNNGALVIYKHSNYIKVKESYEEIVEILT